MKRTITIKDVAKELSCSISTVSRAFNDKYDINPETRRKILERAREMGYTPNPLARRLPQHQTFLIGVVVPEFINAFFPRVIAGIQEIMLKAGYQVLIMSSNEDERNELEIVKKLEAYQVDGLIISFTYRSRDMSYFQSLIDRNFPIVQFNRVSSKLNTPKVIFDDYQWAACAVEHLIEQGNSRIYHFAGPGNMWVTQNRKRGFVDAMHKHGLPCGPETIFEAGIFSEDGAETARRLIQTGNIPQAIFCFNDPLAIGAMQEFKEHGYEIPRDVAFVGFTESSIARYVTPGLTSVEQPTQELGEKVARLLLELIRTHHPLLNQTLVLNGKLNIRRSSLRK